jgi:hypothetical protein
LRLTDRGAHRSSLREIGGSPLCRNRLLLELVLEVVMEDAQLFSVEELEARFEMEAVPVTGSDVLPDWTCECNIKFAL